MMKPSKGRIVFVPDTHNGNSEAPAMIVSTHGEDLVNVRVLSDSSETPEWRTSVKLHDEKPDNPGHDAWWPPRV